MEFWMESLVGQLVGSPQNNTTRTSDGLRTGNNLEILTGLTLGTSLSASSLGTLLSTLENTLGTTLGAILGASLGR